MSTISSHSPKRPETNVLALVSQSVNAVDKHVQNTKIMAFVEVSSVFNRNETGVCSFHLSAG